MKRITAIVAASYLLCAFAYAGGELAESGYAPTRNYTPPAATCPPPATCPQPAPAVAEPAPKTPTGRSIEGNGIHKYGFDLQRNLPMPAPSRCMGHGKEYNEFYGPTYYDPWHHNVWERLNPTYYPFTHPTEWPNYKAPGDYCNGKLCGPSRSSHYWDSYDDWKRGGRYEQRQ